MKFIIEVEIEPDSFLNHYLEANGINPSEFEGNIEDAMEEELGWMQNSGIIKTTIVR
jgi:hypothetical protein